MFYKNIKTQRVSTVNSEDTRIVVDEVRGRDVRSVLYICYSLQDYVVVAGDIFTMVTVVVMSAPSSIDYS